MIQQQYKTLAINNLESAAFNVEGMASLGIQISGTWSATLQFEGTVDGTNWVALEVRKPTDGSRSSSTTANGLWVAQVAGFKAVRVRASAYTSGTASVTFRAIATGGEMSAGGTTSSASTANTPEILTAAGNALVANAARKGWMIQNLGTNPLFVRLAASASTSVFHVVLKGGSGNDDGLGASFAQMDGVVYTGIVSVAGTSPRFVVTEL